uniref:SDR family NAD(P)-dependent oxidoreductase n=1 Tax=Ndongobacter massiliensis TaxID=1871025 RepID=UPI0009301625|nr:SDR family NAD(P)-dependent oxidoreductase [Ndongobacter massiliensis]
MDNNQAWIDLYNKKVVVTGGSSGIGEQIVVDLVNCGAKVFILDRQSPSQKLLDRGALYKKTDLTSIDEIADAFKVIDASMDQIDALVNNAGVTRPRILVDYYKQEKKYEINEQDYYFMSDINIKGTLFVSQEATRRFLQQNHGNIINMSSAAGLNGSKGHSVYAATKAAINAFTLSWAKELAPFNIRVNSIAPDILERTPANNDEKYRAQAYGRGMDISGDPAELAKVFFKGYKSSIPLGRPGKLSEVSNLVCYLVSSHSSYITGTIIPVAGGKTRV